MSRLTQTETEVAWLINNAVYVSAGGLSSLDIEEGTTELIYPTKEKVHNFSIEGSSLYINTSSKKVFRYDLDSKKQEDLFTPVTRVVYSAHPSCFLALNTDDNSENTTSTLVGCDKKPFVINSAEEILASFFTNDGSFLVFATRTSLKFVDLKSMNLGSFKNTPNIDSQILVAAPSMDNFMFANENTYFSSLKDIKPIKVVDLGYSFSIENGVVDYYPDKQSFVVGKNSSFSETEKLSVLKKLENDGYNPDLYQIKFDELSSDDYRW
mgnify:FL=1